MDKIEIKKEIDRLNQEIEELKAENAELKLRLELSQPLYSRRKLEAARSRVADAAADAAYADAADAADAAADAYAAAYARASAYARVDEEKAQLEIMKKYSREALKEIE